jgi:hypothetical protein
LNYVRQSLTCARFQPLCLFIDGISNIGQTLRGQI